MRGTLGPTAAQHPVPHIRKEGPAKSVGGEAREEKQAGPHCGLERGPSEKSG